jgi:hypothetical protein
LAAAGTLTLAGGAAVALQNPNGTGQPATGQNPVIACGPDGFPATPGNSTNAGGSAFNPSGTSGSVYAGNGPGSAHSNSGHSVSEYDIACYQQTQLGH